MALSAASRQAPGYLLVPDRARLFPLLILSLRVHTAILLLVLVLLENTSVAARRGHVLPFLLGFNFSLIARDDQIVRLDHSRSSLKHLALYFANTLLLGVDFLLIGGLGRGCFTSL